MPSRRTLLRNAFVARLRSAIIGKASDCHLPAEFLAALQPSMVL